MENLSILDVSEAEMARRKQYDAIRLTASSLLRERGVVTIEDTRPDVQIAVDLGLMTEEGEVVATSTE
jgi:hypothetical protein